MLATARPTTTDSRPTSINTSPRAGASGGALFPSGQGSDGIHTSYAAGVYAGLSCQSRNDIHTHFAGRPGSLHRFIPDSRPTNQATSPNRDASGGPLSPSSHGYSDIQTENAAGVYAGSPRHRLFVTQTRPAGWSGSHHLPGGNT
jgi:hypothetical protein